jgi:hypothetical protein
MDFVRVTQEVITEKGVIHAGDVFLVDHRLGGWKIVGGRFDGYFLQDLEIALVPEFFQMKQELLQRREEVSELMQRADQLLNENIQLHQELEEVRYAKKVQLPRNVAEALEKAKKWTNGDLELIAWCVPDLNWTKSQESYWSTLRRFGDEKSFFELIDALRYGYVIESPGDRIQQRLIEVFEKKGGYSKGTAVELADHIVPIILEELDKMEREKAAE